MIDTMPTSQVSPIEDPTESVSMQSTMIETPSFLNPAASSAPPTGHFADLVSGKAPVATNVSMRGRFGASLAGYGAAFVVFVGVVFSLANAQAVVTGLFPRAQAAYDLFGVPMVLGQPDLLFDQVTFITKDATLTIKGNIKNQDSMQQNVMPVRVALMGSIRPEPLTIWVFRPEKTFLNPSEVVPFTLTRPFGRSAEVTKVTLSFIE
jgi:hypothetical protein